MVSTLVHADYSARASILVVKHRYGFMFRNPGCMRVPAEQALRGGESDCRNRMLHQMFLMINLGERAGSGLPKICQGWESTGGTLSLYDTFEPYDQTRLEMRWQDVEKEKGDMSGKLSGKILDAAIENEYVTIPELARQMGVSERTIERNIQKLQAGNKLRRIGPARGGRWEVI